ncbi:MAG: T9SS type A sorting domain-containing protein [Ferruginibacter sp.]
MKKNLQLLFVLLILSVSATAQILRPFTPRYYNSSARGGIVYISNSIVSTAGVGSGNPGTGEAPAGGSTTNNSGNGINIDIDGVPADTIVAIGSAWKYLANNTRPATWHTTGYNDAAWPSGNGQLGYGDGDEATCIPSGGGGTVCLPTGNKYISYYFRKAVNIANPASYADFSLGVYRDDGVVVYVNGVEVYRDNMPAGAVTHATLASTACSDNGNTLQTATIPTSAFVAGNNVIAVEIHQNAASSSDVSFDLELIANPITNVSIFPFNSAWKYLANNTRPATWHTSGYNDAAWPSGNGQFGYGDGDETTCVPSGGGGTVCTPTGTKYITTYFRKTINIANPAIYPNFLINLIRDDGAVVYVNGVEVVRDNMPTGVIAHGTFASSNVAGAAESTVYPFLVPSSYFVSGNNTIAVEIHQDDATSSDLSFDMELKGSTDSTFNSSSADLNLPSCSNILFAGLYWSTGEGSNTGSTAWITGETTCKLKLPGAANYTNITSSQTDYWNPTLIPSYAHTGYQSFANITSLVNATNPNGTYTLANVTSPLGIHDAYGGWTIVIVYGNPSLTPRNLTVFDGCAGVKSGSGNVDVPIAGFLTPASGPVSCELGTVVYDGDRTSGDGFQFRQTGAPSFYDMATTTVPLNGAGDAWNSKISHKGAVVTTRNPAFQNTLGYDASVFDLPNTANAQLSNSQTSATVRVFSNNENVILHVLTTSISQYNPSFTFDKTATDINGGLLVPGDSIRYQINYNNTGNDSSTNTVIIDNIPSGSAFIPGSIRINGVAKTDIAADDQAEYQFANNRVVLRIGVGADASSGGNIGPGVSGNITFDVVTASSCDILACSGSLRNEARIGYNGKRSGTVLSDSSGVSTAGCVIKGPVITPVSGPCFSPKDTLLVNQCNNLSVMLPWRRYAGYTFYSAKPFIPANIYNQYNPVTFSNVFWAYYSNGASCSDTARIQVFITVCPDIDDDNDGIPDYVEFDDPLALVVVGGLPNWNRPSYPGYVDNNSDGVNDLFDWGADADNDGIPNFQDTDFWKGWLDTNADGVNDKADKDLDGIPNQYDLDSDNDGIPDVVESYGVDTDGDGIIDNYTDTDNDGFSQNVDANNTGVNGSSNGLGAQDFDADGIPNYLDLDSDNDGIPDIVESYGADTNNDALVDGFADTNGDGIADNFLLATAILKTGVDANNDGRADNYPNKNKDQDFRPNAYDMDSDGDGIVDVIEAGFPDANLNGVIDGVIGANGWATVISGQPTLSLRFTDSDPYPDYLDIDSDDDGIPDNIEGQSTAGYILPGLTDTDGDGLVNSYDNVVGFGGSGIYVYDHDGDTTPDYLDLDSDGDGQPDIIEGNDFNLNGLADDNVTPTGLDTDGDGLDNRFDSLTSVTNIKGTSYRMGTGGTFTGDPVPGSRTTVQKKIPAQTDRDWRYVGIVLPVQFLSFTAVKQNNTALLTWKIIAEKEIERFEIERSFDNNRFYKTAQAAGTVLLNQLQSFSATDDITNVTGDIIYYRLKVIGKAGEIKYSNVAIIRVQKIQRVVTVMPNPAKDYVLVNFDVDNDAEVTLRLIDNIGQVVLLKTQKVVRGNNTIQLDDLSKYNRAVYLLQVKINEEVITEKIVLTR